MAIYNIVSYPDRRMYCVGGMERAPSDVDLWGEEQE